MDPSRPDDKNQPSTPGTSPTSDATNTGDIPGVSIPQPTTVQQEPVIPEPQKPPIQTPAPPDVSTQSETPETPVPTTPLAETKPPQQPDFKPYSPPVGNAPTAASEPTPSAAAPTPSPTPPLGQVMKPPTSLSRKPGGFRLFVIFAVIIILIIYAVVAYLYFQNRDLKQEDVTPQEGTQQEITPTPEFSADQVKILNGSVVYEKPGETPEVLVDKEAYESTGITGFSRVAVSPDNTRLCFEATPPAPEPALYISKVDGSEVVEVSPNREDCVWASDSTKIYYVNSAASTSAVDIYSYVLETQTEENLTADSSEEGVVRRFEIVGLSADASSLMCSYVEGDESETANQCEINLQTNELTLL